MVQQPRARQHRRLQTPDVITGRLQQLQAVLAEVDSINDGVNISRPLRPEMAEVSTGMFGWGKKVGGNLGEIQLTMRDGDPELNPNNYQVGTRARLPGRRGPVWAPAWCLRHL